MVIAFGNNKKIRNIQLIKQKMESSYKIRATTTVTTKNAIALRVFLTDPIKRNFIMQIRQCNQIQVNFFFECVCAAIEFSLIYCKRNNILNLLVQTIVVDRNMLFQCDCRCCCFWIKCQSQFPAFWMEQCWNSNNNSETMRWKVGAL